MKIKFYSTTGKYGVFSNFAKFPIKIEEKIYPTVEHYFQSSKFFGTEDEYSEEIRGAKTAKEAASMGRNRQYKLRDDWESIKNKVMFDGVYLKFSLYPQLKEILLSTGDLEIVEDSPIDYYWGVGADGSGQNHLGKILMKVRGLLK